MEKLQSLNDKKILIDGYIRDWRTRCISGEIVILQISHLHLEPIL